MPEPRITIPTQLVLHTLLDDPAVERYGVETFDLAVNGGGPTGFSFTPANRSANVGDTVLFKNISSDVHSIHWTSPGSPADSPIFNTGGGTTTIVMPNAGTFNYFCGVHGSNMNGSVTVT